MSAVNMRSRKTSRALRKKMAKLQLRGKKVKLERQRARLIPRVRHIDPFTKESFLRYYSRWHRSLKNIPACVVEQWAYEHNDEFIEFWSKLLPRKWNFTLKEMTTEEVMTIQMLENDLGHYENAGNRCIDDRYARTRLSEFMFNFGTFPKPIIVFSRNSSLLHPRSYGEQFFTSNYHLAEGHTRLGLFRAINNRGLGQLENHSVWVIELNT
ncbi:hypothetical protein REH77_05740 [Vibrio alginolyticus]|uniref:hypothetical protein n=1 Tax=Vibrio alginolyticus TaxID=663 RepID=UPI001EEAA245|nr:hypothetical protein [Vibrio alginolyticus]EGR0148762.1 hypothetical protein [Vibrio alginolyticus]MCG6332474.1 hypothetical protein [Vibrio alginolyticus]MCG6336828.1 hypothetical protein [Vibrio alginolyticus]